MKSKEYSFIRYLSAKKSVDDRALNQRVWEQLAFKLSSVDQTELLQVLEVGAGIGTMVERLLEKGMLRRVNYLGIDAEIENSEHAQMRLAAWGEAGGFQISKNAQQVTLSRPGQQARVSFKTCDLFDFAAQEHGQRRWDLLVAHAFLDLMDIPATLPKLFGLLKKRGLFYFTMNFDGLTILQPTIDLKLDELIPDLYHRSMDQRRVKGSLSGDSRAGRHLFTHLTAAGGEILEAGSSDWIVYPEKSGYRQDEAYFLHFILHTIEQELRGHPELDQANFLSWIKQRHAQVERGELVYIAHQLDFLGRLSREQLLTDK